MYASSEGYDETAQMHSLVLAIAAQLCDKYKTLMCRPIYELVKHLTLTLL